jgi:hypothetical protein
MLFLKKCNCHVIAPEVTVHRVGLRYRNDLDSHYTIDVLGIGKKYLPLDKQVRSEDGLSVKRYRDIIRGIEIKVSRSDFKNGFIQSGCSYHYLMTPRGLVAQSEVPRGIGLIEVDVENFSWRRYNMLYLFSGLEVTRKPTYVEMDEVLFGYYYSQADKACTDQMIRWARKALPHKTWRELEDGSGR